MAVFGRVRNWRVCTRSLYAVPLSPFLYLFRSLSLSFFLPVFLLQLVVFRLRSPSHLSPFLFHGTVSASRSFFRRRDSLCHPLRVFPTRASRHVVSRRLLSLSFPSVYSAVYSSRILVRDSQRRRGHVSLKPLFVATPLMVFRRLAV